jgi:hypothetical protein
MLSGMYLRAPRTGENHGKHCSFREAKYMTQFYTPFVEGGKTFFIRIALCKQFTLDNGAQSGLEWRMIDSDIHNSNLEADESPGKRAPVEIGEWARVGPEVIPLNVATNRQRNACCQSGRST